MFSREPPFCSRIHRLLVILSSEAKVWNKVWVFKKFHSKNNAWEGSCWGLTFAFTRVSSAFIFSCSIAKFIRSRSSASCDSLASCGATSAGRPIFAASAVCCLRRSWEERNETSTLSQRKGRAFQPSITWGGSQPGGGSASWGGGPPQQWRRHDTIRPIRLTVALGLKTKRMWWSQEHFKRRKSAVLRLCTKQVVQEVYLLPFLSPLQQLVS